jgi:hypothetical protein
MHYLPRSIQKLDPILGEDPLSKFTLAIPIEMYYEDALGWQGDMSIISKFGLDIKKEMTFTVSKPRWAEEVGKLFDNVTATGNTEANFDVMVNYRPQEGDLIWEPLSKSLLEIKFVEHEQQFYPVSTNFYYKLKCEFFAYSNETIATDITELDNAFTSLSKDLYDQELLMEDGFKLLSEDGGSIFLDMTEDTFTRGASDNQEFRTESINIEWDVDNPFADLPFVK